MQVTLPYRPNPSQRPFHASPARYKLLLGAAGSGKTVALCMEDILEAIDYPRSTGVVFRRYYPSLRDTTKRTYLELCPKELIAREIKSEGREELQFVNGSRTIFRVLDDYKKLGSMAFDRVKIDEAIEIEEREFLALIARMRGKVGPRRICLATNPPDEDHWLYQWFVERGTPDRVVFHSSTYDNAENLPPEYVSELEQYPPAWKEKFLYGRWGFLSEGQPVFEDFNAQVHVAELPITPELKVIRGWDFGYVHPACLAPGHRVLAHDLRWVAVESLMVGDKLLAFEEDPLNHSRRWCASTILATNPAVKPRIRVTLDDGTTFVCSADHHFLITERTHTDGRAWRNGWIAASDLHVGQRIPRFFTPWENPKSYMEGWVAGFYDGEGSLYLRDDSHLELSISQVRNGLLERLRIALELQGFYAWLSAQQELRPNQQDTDRLFLRGGWSEQIRFLGTYRPERLLKKYSQFVRELGPHMQKEVMARVVDVAPVGAGDVIVLETSSRTYIAEGYGHHNCVWLQQLPSGHLYWLRELMGTNMDLRTFAQEVLRLTTEWFPENKEFEDYCDIAGTYKNDRAPTSAQILRNEFNIPTYARKYSVHFTIERMRGLLRTLADGQRLLQIDESCRLSRRAFAGGYHMDAKKDEPSKDGFYDNIVDAGRYPITAVTMGFGTDPAAQKYQGKQLPPWRLAI